MGSEMEFKYEPISLRGPAFRLLRLLKGDSDTVQCELWESQLPPQREFVGYEALSYTWGSESKPCEVIINQRRMEITKNAYLALRDLRYREKDRILWIDALCIDQNNKQERSQQVQQMRTIFKNAERVIIWLGEATFDTNYAMHYMQQLEKQLDKAGFDSTSNNIEVLDEQLDTAWSLVACSLSNARKDLLAEGLKSLLQRHWFRRVWIIQEVVNAQVAEIACGSTFVSSIIFSRMPYLLGITPDPHCEPILQIMPGPLRDHSWWSEKPDLRTILLKFCESEATDPRDKIYALLGISSDACDTDLLQTNYEEEFEDVILNTVLFFLKIDVLDPPIRRFLSWSLPDLLERLNDLANELLRYAMEAGQEALVRLLIVRDDVDVNINAIYNETPLSWAVRTANEAVIRKILKLDKTDIRIRDYYEKTPLLWAAEKGHEAVVKLLLETGKVDVNSKDWSNRTPLSWAAGEGHEAVVKLLLETGKADVNSKDDDQKKTPLSWAARHGHDAVVKLLLETGKVDVDSKDDSNRTPLFWAVFYRREAVVRLLLETCKADVNTKDANEETPFLLAAENRDRAIVKLLFETGKVDTKPERVQKVLKETHDALEVR